MPVLAVYREESGGLAAGDGNQRAAIRGERHLIPGAVDRNRTAITGAHRGGESPIADVHQQGIPTGKASRGDGAAGWKSITRMEVIIPVDEAYGVEGGAENAGALQRRRDK